MHLNFLHSQIAFVKVKFTNYHGYMWVPYFGTNTTGACDAIEHLSGVFIFFYCHIIFCLSLYKYIYISVCIYITLKHFTVNVKVYK